MSDIDKELLKTMHLARMMCSHAGIIGAQQGMLPSWAIDVCVISV